MLVDYTGRLFRDGKAAISAELNGILERLGSSAESWQARPSLRPCARWISCGIMPRPSSSKSGSRS